MELKTYYDFALDDYRFLIELKKNGITANSIGAIAQNTCERFLKHLINEFIPVSESNRQSITDILITHNLNRLVSFWNQYSENKIPNVISSKLKRINGFYFSTKYPGDDCQTLTAENISSCYEAVEACKQVVDDIISSYNKEAHP
ncbi:MAG: hypothetical protein II813_01520 [Spirochaetales bacterium]|nr:hypothetical protein [Spirochaetales bacterium]MBQ3829583.1 hypothetical protein [Spirochaetales bacterium]